MTGVLPPAEAVRIEEMVKYFDYAYATPAGPRRAVPAHDRRLLPRRGTPERQIVHIGIQGLSLPAGERPAANLVFLLDVSGSMDDPEDELPLLKKSLAMLAGELTRRTACRSSSMPARRGRFWSRRRATTPRRSWRRSTISRRADRQRAAKASARLTRLPRRTGSRRGQPRDPGDRRRFQRGHHRSGALEGYVARERESGVTLTVLGFGRGNYNDELMQKLAQAGNGNAAYIDTLNEARKTLVEEMQGTLFTIAGDVKFQVEFNPACVSEYRQIGYETRQLKREDFNNDKVDAGDLGAGHRVTALYEITRSRRRAASIRCGTDRSQRRPRRARASTPI